MSNFKYLLSLDSKERIQVITEVLSLRKKLLGKDFDENEVDEIEEVIQKVMKKENASDSNSDKDNKSKDKPSQDKINKAVKVWADDAKKRGEQFIQGAPKR